MELKLVQGDLQEAHIHCPTSSVGFEHLNANVQKGVIDIGRATFYRYERTTREEYKIIYPPKK